MKVVFCCEDCKLTYYANAGKTGKCPKCGGNLLELDISADEWDNLSEEEKWSILNPEEEDDDGVVSTEEDFVPTDSDEKQSTASKLAGFGSKIAQAGGKAIVNKFKERKVGAIVIDEANHRFRIEGGEIIKAKKDGVAAKLVKGTMALSTAGLSVLAEKGAKAGVNAVKGLQWYDFDELIRYSVSMDNQREYQSSGSRVRVAKGLSIGGTKAVSKTVTHSMDIVVSLDNLSTPSVRIPIITKPLKGSAFNNAVKYGDDTKRGLEYIISHK